jgi:acyl-CoA dehydrogenase
LRFNGLVVHERDRIGEQDEGFRYLLSGLNAERILISSESIGDGMYFVRRASEYATERHVFGRAIGENQGIQFPISEAYMHVRASSFMRDYAATLCERGEPYGSEANMAKWLSSVAACQAGDIAMMTFGGYGMASEYGIERKFREARLNLVAPVSNNMVLGHIATHVLKMPRSF